LGLSREKYIYEREVADYYVVCGFLLLFGSYSDSKTVFVR
jgi:hypothetical protein